MTFLLHNHCDWLKYLFAMQKFGKKWTSIGKRKGLLFCSAIFGFCVKISMHNQHFESFLIDTKNLKINDYFSEHLFLKILII